MTKKVQFEMTLDEIRAMVELKYIGSAMYFASGNISHYHKSFSSVIDRMNDCLNRMEELIKRYGLQAFESNITKIADRK